MAQCYKNVGTPRKRMCIGKMDKRILIQKRTQRHTSSGMVYTFETVYTLWANLKTNNGLERFSDINISEAWSHLWKVRKNKNITTEYWVNYDDNNYKLISINHLDDARYTFLYSRETGDDDLQGSQS